MLKTTKEIIKLIDKGVAQMEIRRRGYPVATVRYHWRKIKNPKRHQRALERMRRNRIKAKKLVSPKPPKLSTRKR